MNRVLPKNASNEAIREYIAGEEFDPVEYERENLIRLKKSALKCLETIKPQNIHNLKDTVSHWLEVNKNMPHKKEYEDLRVLFTQI